MESSSDIATHLCKYVYFCLSKYLYFNGNYKCKYRATNNYHYGDYYYGNLTLYAFRAASEDDVDSLHAWHLAGASFFLTDHENRTAIQVVCIPLCCM